MRAGESTAGGSTLPEIDKIGMGQRIKRLRQEAGLRQWELARLLGTTQSAVHKYEHGVVPEPRRLMELARVGHTSIEWILTGRHWENGAEEPERLSADLLRTASLLRELKDEDRGSLERALAVLRDAVEAFKEGAVEGTTGEAAARRWELFHHGEDALSALDAAARVQRAVLRRLARHAAAELGGSGLLGPENGAGPADKDRPWPPPRTSS